MTPSPEHIERIKREMREHGVDLEELAKNPPTDPAGLEDATNPVADPEVVATIEPPDEPIYQRPTRNFTEFYFPAREKKPPKQTHIEIVNEKGEKENISLTDFKQARRVYFTVRRDSVDYCGHKVDLYAGPKNNCRACWFAYFNQHAELVKALDEAYAEHGSKVIDATRGTKFRKHFMLFLAEVAFLRREQALRTNDGDTEVNGETILGAASGSDNEENSGDKFKLIPAAEAII